MKSIIKIIAVFLLLGISISGSSKNLREAAVTDGYKSTVELTINNDKYLITDVNSNARVYVYSIIGSKVTSFEIKSGVCDSSITLPKGYYILKIDDSTRKIAVK